MKRTIAPILIAAVMGYNLPAQAVQFNVNCNTGQSLSKAVNRAKADDSIVVTGECDESIVIQENGISIIGNGASIRVDNINNDNSAVTISGAQRVSITGLDIFGGHFGIFGNNGATFQLQDVAVAETQINGIQLSDASHADFHDVAVAQTGGNGVNLANGASISVTGSFSIQNAGSFGLNAQSVSSVLTHDANITISGSRGMGVHIVTGSNLFINNTQLLANFNVLRGISINSGSGFFAFNSDISANNTIALDGLAFANAVIDIDRSSIVSANGNGRDGIVVEASTFTSFIFPPFGGPTLSANNNRRHGVRAVLGSKIELKEGTTLTVTGNGAAGMLIDDGSTANLRNSTVENNDANAEGWADIELSFASRLDTVSGNTIGTLSCDATVASRGQVVCP